MRVVRRRFVREPILKDYYLKECPYLDTSRKKSVVYGQPNRRKPIGLASCYVDQKPHRWVSLTIMQSAEYQKEMSKIPVEGCFVKILFAREYGGKFPRNLKITTFYNNGKGKAESRNHFF